MNLRLFQIDAFAERVFSGNPAAVCPLDSWLDKPTMQRIAAENNLSETAFCVPKDGAYELRWFTPTTEVDLCGHATLATAFVIWRHLHHDGTAITFHTRGGPLHVERQAARLTLDLPAKPSEPCENPPAELLQALGLADAGVRRGEAYLVVLGDEPALRELSPDFVALAQLDLPGVVVTAPGSASMDFVSRYFAPAQGIDEDPVTGFAHCLLTPYWSERLGKVTTRARQISKRGGELWCELRDDRVRLSGHAVEYLQGTITI